MGNVVRIEQARMERDIPEIDTGFIKVYRSLQECSFKRDPNKVALWVHMLLEASHKPFKTVLGGKTVELQAGQFISGNRDLEKETGVSVQSIKTAIKFFEREEMLVRSTGKDGTVFTVLKYESYQAKKSEKTNPPLTHQINPQSNPVKASSDAASDESATHKLTHHQPTQLTRIQEDNINTSISKDIDCRVGGQEQGKKKLNPKDQAKSVISHFNKVSGKQFKGSKSDIKTISARLAEGFTVEEMNMISDYKTSTWLRDPSMSKFLRPETLFSGKHCDSYLNDALDAMGLADCPHKAILDVWAKVMPELPQPNFNEWEPSREAYQNLAHRWQEGFVTMKNDGTGTYYSDQEGGVVWWERFLRYASRSDRLMNDIKSFSLPWITKRENFLAVKEGGYHA